MSDWEDFCETFNIDPNNPDQFDDLLDRWSKEERLSGVSYQMVNIKAFFQSLANPYCSRCGGAGYIGTFKRIEDGRCFKCIPDNRRAQLVTP